MKYSAKVKLTQNKLKEAGIFRKKRDIAEGSLRFFNSTFDTVDLTGVYLPRAQFTNCRLTGTDLSGSNLVGAVFFNGCRLDKVYLCACDLSDANFVDVDLTTSFLRGALLKRTNFNESPGVIQLKTPRIRSLAHYSIINTCDGGIYVMLDGPPITPHVIGLYDLLETLKGTHEEKEKYVRKYCIQSGEESLITDWCCLVKNHFRYFTGEIK